MTDTLEDRIAQAEQKHINDLLWVKEEFKIEQWLNDSYGLNDSFVRLMIYQSIRYPAVSISEAGYRRNGFDSLLPLFYLLNKMAKDPRVGFFQPLAGQLDNGRWEFPLNKASHEDAYPTYPLSFHLKQDEKAVGPRRKKGFRSEGFTAQWSVLLDHTIHIDFRMDFATWQPLLELGLSKNEWGWRERDQKRFYPIISGWEYIHYQGGRTTFFIPSGFIWANGMGWEEELLETEYDRA